MAKIHLVDAQSPEPLGSMARALDQALREMGITPEQYEKGLTSEQYEKQTARARELLGQE